MYSCMIGLVCSCGDGGIVDRCWNLFVLFGNGVIWLELDEDEGGFGSYIAIPWGREVVLGVRDN